MPELCLCGTPALEATAPSSGKWGSFHTEAGVPAPSPSLGEPWAATVSKNLSPHNHVRSGSHYVGKKDEGAEEFNYKSEFLPPFFTT